MENKYLYKECQPNANKNAAHLVCPFKFQRDDIAKVSKLFPIDLKQPTHQIPNMDETPSI